jgi:hypothetical protein
MLDSLLILILGLKHNKLMISGLGKIQESTGLKASHLLAWLFCCVRFKLDSHLKKSRKVI